MINILNKLESNLNKLEELDKNKFSSNDFKEVNQQLEVLVGQVISSIKIDYQKNPFVDQQALIDNILSKIEKLEAKILPKANLLNSFSQSII